MKYNTTYTQKISLKDTIKKIDEIIKQFEIYYSSRFKMINVIPPSFVEEGNPMIIDVPFITRPITFDITDGYKVGQLLLTHSNWMRSLFQKLDLQEGEGIQARSSTIWRDLPINPASDTERQELIFQFRIPKDRDAKAIVKEETDKLYSLLKDMESQIFESFNIPKTLPRNPSYISAQMLENEYPSIPYKDREENMADELISFVLQNPSIRLFSGHIHSYIPSEIYVNNNFNKIVVKDPVNTSVFKIASVGQIATGQILSDQLAMSSKDYLKESNFYMDQIKNDYNIIEIKINIGLTALSLMKKGHISEVQPENISDETKVISTRYKIETY